MYLRIFNGNESRLKILRVVSHVTHTPIALVSDEQMFFLHTGQGFPWFSLVLVKFILHTLIRLMGWIKIVEQQAHNDVIVTKISRDWCHVVSGEWWEMMRLEVRA